MRVWMHVRMHVCMCVCACVCACVRARVYACTCSPSLTCSPPQGTLVTKVRLQQKQREGIAEKRSGRRGPASVLGSGFAGALCSLAAVLTDSGAEGWVTATATATASSSAAVRSAAITMEEVAAAGAAAAATSSIWQLGFVASFATKLSDTVSSEIGKAYGKTTWVHLLTRQFIARLRISTSIHCHCYCHCHCHWGICIWPGAHSPTWLFSPGDHVHYCNPGSS